LADLVQATHHRLGAGDFLANPALIRGVGVRAVSGDRPSAASDAGL